MLLGESGKPLLVYFLFCPARPAFTVVVCVRVAYLALETPTQENGAVWKIAVDLPPDGILRPHYVTFVIVVLAASFVAITEILLSPFGLVGNNNSAPVSATLTIFVTDTIRADRSLWLPAAIIGCQRTNT